MNAQNKYKFISTNDKSETFQGVRENLKEHNSEYSINKFGMKLWIRLRFNEWTFTFILFLFSLSIVVGKLFFNYDFSNYLDITDKKLPSSLINKSHFFYKDVINKALASTVYQYSWLIKAVVSGLTTTVITWIIIYQDSSVPGVNPPYPFSPRRKRISESSSFQINYLVGVLNGCLIFFYMCL